MNYIKKSVKSGINVHLIKTSKFKTNLFSIFLTVPLQKETVTKNALIASVLRRGTAQMPTQEEISKNLEEMYGASFDCGIDKTGDNHVIKFYLECINDEFLPGNDKIAKKCFDILLSIAFNPTTRNGHFLQEYVETEKENLKQIIEGKIDNKRSYASERCIEEMYKNQPYGLYKFGYVEDLNNIDAKGLYEYYQDLIKTAKIDIFVSGNLADDTINMINSDELLQNLNEREPNYIINKNEIKSKSFREDVNANIVEEKLQVNQGKLMLGLDVITQTQDAPSKYATSVYNIILGGSANSKLFQNVREKASLAYTAGSNYIRIKNNIIIKSGIEIKNYDKALEIIKEQLEEIKQGKFTDEEVENAKKLIISTVGSISDSQDSEITYYLSQELSDEFVTIDEYIKNIEQVDKKQVINVANSIKINTIYFLRN